MIVTALHLYPIKSCGGIDVETLRMGPRGPVGDRHWMVVDSSGMFVTQRTHPRMALVKVTANRDKLQASSKGSGAVGWDWLRENGGEPTFEARVWKDTVTVVAASAEVNDWFSAFLGQPVRLARLADGKTRTRDREVRRWEVNFPDAAPILLINSSSLADLNARLGQTLPMNRFRPNIVFESGLPYIEDRWREIRVGEIVFPFMYPCTRCVITTVDQTTAVKGIEPLKMLATYRRVSDGIAFGVRMVHRGEGTIKIGDVIQDLC